MAAFNPTQKNVFFATKQLLALMSVNIKPKVLTDLLVGSREFPSLASVVAVLETLKIKNLPVFLKKEQLVEIPLPAIVQLTINDNIFVPVRKIENQNVEWCDEKTGWQSESLAEFIPKWTGIVLLVDDSTTFYAKKEFSKESNLITQYLNISIVSLTFLYAAYLIDLFDTLFSQTWQTLLLFIANVIGLIIFFSVSHWKNIECWIVLFNL